MLEHMVSKGIEHYESLAEARSQKLYNCLDSCKSLVNSVSPDFRSRMNIPFNVLPDGQKDSSKEKDLLSQLSSA